tara:strand:+ start:2773 stop:3030 length:258 start_codon:yes stop_codon:yes gene_type:complete
MAHADEIRMCKQIAELEAHIALLRIIAEAAERWSKNLPGWMLEDIGPGAYPTFYGTLSHEGDLKVIEQTKQDLAALAAAKAGGAM